MTLEHLYGSDIEIKHPQLGWFWMSDVTINYNESLNIDSIVPVGLESMEGQHLTEAQMNILIKFIQSEYEETFKEEVSLNAYVPSKDELFLHNSNEHYD